MACFLAIFDISNHFYLSLILQKPFSMYSRLNPPFKCGILKQKEIIMADRTATAIWQGNLKEGKGKVELAGTQLPYSFSSRFEEGQGSNPEELIAAAHAGCYAMALSNEIANQGYTVEKVEVSAKISLRFIDGKPTIVSSHLDCKAQVPELNPETFLEIAEATKMACPVSRALNLEITLDACLVNPQPRRGW